VLLEARDRVVARGGFGCGRGDDFYLLGTFSALSHHFLIASPSFPHRCGLGGDRWFGFKCGRTSARLAWVFDFHGKPAKC